MNSIAHVLPSFIQQNPHLFCFIFLFLFAFTLPICEEIAVALVGVTTRALGTDFVSIAIVAIAALLIQDYALFLIARTFGPRIMRHRFVARFFKPDKVVAAERYFRRRGPVIILGSRFVVGLRISAILGSGFLRMSWSKFLLFDSIAASMMTPAWLFVGYSLGAQFDQNAGPITRILAIIGPVAVLFAAFLVYRGVKADAAAAAKADSASEAAANQE